LLFTPLSSVVYLVIYRSGQLEKTNNILNAKTHATPASVPVIACRSLRVLPSQVQIVSDMSFTLFPSLSFSTAMKRHQCSFFSTACGQRQCSASLVWSCLTKLLWSCPNILMGAPAANALYSTSKPSLHAAAFFLFLSPLLSLSSSSLVVVAIAGFPSHARVKPTAALDRAGSPASREHMHVPSPFPSASVHRRG